MSDPGAAVAAAYASDWARIVAGLIRITGSWSLAEDCTQDAFEAALRRWPTDGVPPNPGGWLTLTARHAAIDRLRRSANEATKLQQRAIMDELDSVAAGHAAEADLADDRLRLIFTCCHPALSMPARVALTLRTVAGVSTADVAAAFLVPTSTMAQRLVRAQRKISHAAIPYRVPALGQLPDRLRGVLAALYLLFNQGYRAPAEVELAATAIRLTRLVQELLPDEGEVDELLALMLFQHSRRHARRSPAGALVTLDEQDRELWVVADVEDAHRQLRRALARGEIGAYGLQAAIAACHADAPTPEATDWPRILTLYDRLLSLGDSPVVQLNRAVALGLSGSYAEALTDLDRLAAGGRLECYPVLPAAQADLSRRLGDRVAAATHYRKAIAMTDDEAESAYLRRRLAEVS